MKRYRRLRRLQPDAELIRRRAAGETFRELCGDYRVSHTTLSRYFARPEVARQVKWARQLVRADHQAAETRWRAERQAERAARRQARAQQAAERQGAASARTTPADLARPGGSSVDSRPRPSGTPSRGVRSAVEATPDGCADSLGGRDPGVPRTRTNSPSRGEERAALAVAAGGAMRAVIEATGLRTRENVLALVDPEILERAQENDAGLPPAR